MQERITARGTKVMLEHGGLPEVLNPYLTDLIQQTGGVAGPIGRQFIAQPELERSITHEALSDPLLEEEHEVAPGLVYKYEGGEDEYGKYPGRALFTITRNCAAYCRYCTRGREVGIPATKEGPLGGALSHTPHLSREQVDESLDFVMAHPEINEIILSGGDPMTVHPEVLNYIFTQLGRMQEVGNLDIVRIGTRLPIHNPRAIKTHHIEALSKLHHPRLMIHMNHAAELTEESLDALHRMQDVSRGVVMSQSVLLRGVNDDPGVLRQLFNKVAKEGFVPYYVYQNDPVDWAQHFTVPLPEAYEIWSKVRPVLSGVAATARLVIDTPNGYGKIPLPEGGAWDVNFEAGFNDFKGQRKDFE
jgi:lysine 2,3-aminomutase